MSMDEEDEEEDEDEKQPSFASTMFSRDGPRIKARDLMNIPLKPSAQKQPGNDLCLNRHHWLSKRIIRRRKIHAWKKGKRFFLNRDRQLDRIGASEKGCGEG